jgi:hypothetical protein
MTVVAWKQGSKQRDKKLKKLVKTVKFFYELIFRGEFTEVINLLGIW